MMPLYRLRSQTNGSHLFPLEKRGGDGRGGEEGRQGRRERRAGKEEAIYLKLHIRVPLYRML